MAAVPATLFGLAEDVQAPPRRLELGHALEGLEHPLAVLLLLQVAGLRVLVGQQRGRQVVLDRVAVLELRVELGQEGRVGVQAGHFVLVLVGHQLVEVAGGGLGQLAARQGTLFGGDDALDHLGVALGVGFVLVGDQVGHADFQQALDLALGADAVDDRAGGGLSCGAALS
jgi:hypothetical protein